MAGLDADQIKTRARNLAAQFSAGQMVLAGLMLVVALVGGVAFLKWVSAPSYAVLSSGLDAADAAKVTASLDAAGVAYQLEAGGTTVLVPEDQLSAQRNALAASGLGSATDEQAWASFDKQGMTSSSFQQQVAHQRAIEATLVRSLEAMDGVTSAQVHLAVPEERLFTQDKQATRASVLLEGDVDQSTVEAMTQLVAGAVPGLAAKDVVITDSKGQLLTGDGATGTDKLEQQRLAYEAGLDARATTMLDQMLGAGTSVVRVSATMDRAERTTDTETYDPKKSAVLGSTTSKETYSTGAAAGTTQGTVALPGATAAPSAATGTSGSGGYDKSTSQTTNGVSRTVEHSVQTPGAVKRLTVSVALDRNAPGLPAPDQVSKLVAAAVGLDTARGDTIAVDLAAFPKAEEADATATADAAAGGPLAMVKEQGPTLLSGLLLVVIAVGLLRSLRKSSKPVSDDELTAALEQARPAGALQLPAPRGSSDQLPAAIDQPAEVADLLSGWLADTGRRG